MPEFDNHQHTMKNGIAMLNSYCCILSSVAINSINPEHLSFIVISLVFREVRSSWNFCQILLLQMLMKVNTSTISSRMPLTIMLFYQHGIASRFDTFLFLSLGSGRFS
ncbi:hypothetical protein SAY87_002167 [Trapa incisa]|uniref:Uncharacterized protein n=1 Tax=Trapa incisa TaxID=236973 RepID=A0AAN7JTP0_9MYRT|nr:hypothetical protein SAY87_002167 [Trapa incisa]